MTLARRRIDFKLLSNLLIGTLPLPCFFWQLFTKKKVLLMSDTDQRLWLHPSAESFPDWTSLSNLSVELCKQPTGCSLLSSLTLQMTYV